MTLRDGDRITDYLAMLWFAMVVLAIPAGIAFFIWAIVATCSTR